MSDSAQKSGPDNSASNQQTPNPNATPSPEPAADPTNVVVPDPQLKATGKTGSTRKSAEENQEETLHAIRAGERIALIIAGIVALATIAQLIITILNNKGTSDQTDKLIRAAQMSAHSADHNATSAFSFAQSADGINNGIADAVKKLDAQAKALDASRTASERESRRALRTSIDIARQDQRAWVGPNAISVVLGLGQKLVFKTRIGNSGKSIARHVGLQANYDIEYTTTILSYRYASGPLSYGVLQPGMEALNTVTQDIPLDRATLDALKGDAMRAYVYGYMTYEDVFRVRHFTKFCGYVQSPNLTEVTMCDTYNDAD